MLPACKQSHSREVNDINAANTSGQEMLYVWPSILQELPEIETTVRISIDAFFFGEKFGFANSVVFASVAGDGAKRNPVNWPN